MKKVEESKATSPSVQPIKPRRKFDAAFKRDAVALWLSSGNPPGR
jgi:transposase-like protein